MLNTLFYNLKPAIPRRLQIFLRRRIAAYKRKKYAAVWPIDPRAGQAPAGWQGWPAGKKFALVLSHDVDTRKGYEQVLQLAELEHHLGFRSAFNFVPERYGEVAADLRQALVNLGFEIGVHGLKHDGRLFETRRIFSQRAERINFYLQQWGCKGFTSPSMHNNLEWMHLLNIKHSVSTFDTDPFEPRPYGVKSIFPLWVRNHHSKPGFTELPYTLPQDHALFIILQEQDTATWEQKLAWIVAKGGLALLNTHPDYMNFSNARSVLEEYPVALYRHFLEHLQKKYAGQYWHVLPSELAHFWREQNTT